MVLRYIAFFPLFNKTPSHKRHGIGLVAVEAAPFDSNSKEEHVKLLSLLQSLLNLYGITAPAKVCVKYGLHSTPINEKSTEVFGWLRLKV